MIQYMAEEKSSRKFGEKYVQRTETSKDRIFKKPRIVIHLHARFTTTGKAKQLSA